MPAWSTAFTNSVCTALLRLLSVNGLKVASAGGPLSRLYWYVKLAAGVTLSVPVKVKTALLLLLSAGGVRIRTRNTDVKADGQIRLRLELPDYAGICPFVDHSAGNAVPKKEWIGWMSIARVLPTSNRSEVDIAGRLVDMDDTDRGMLSLYLSTQPMAA